MKTPKEVLVPLETALLKSHSGLRADRIFIIHQHSARLE